MANVGTAPAGKTLIGKGNTTSPTFADIGTDSGLTTHGILIAQGSGSFVASAVGAAGQIFQSSGPGVDPAYSTATYPSTTTINQILYSSANNVVSAITAGNFGVLISNGTGVPSWLANGTTGQMLTATTGGTPTWTTPTSGTVTSVSGTLNRITSTGGATPVIDIAATYVGQTSITTLGTVTTGTWNATAIGPTFGGTGQTTYTTGDILYASAANTLSKLPIGSANQVLTIIAGIPSWQTPTTGTVTSVSGTLNRITSTGGATPVIDIAATYVGQTSITTLGTITTGVWNGSVIPLAFGGTNANLTASNGGIFYSTATAGAILAGTATAGQMLRSGATGAPSWSTATFPATATGTGTILRANGTNWVASTATYPDTTTVNQLLYSSATNVVSGLTNGTTGQVLTATTGSAPSWASPAAGTGVNKVITQTFSTAGSGTYTPSAGMLYCIVELVGAGGGGGGTAATTAAQLAVAGGGGSGAYARTTFSAADIGASKAYTVGAGGAGGTAGANNGTGGTNSTFGTGGTLVQGGGGGGGIGGAASGTISFNLGGAAGVGVVPAGGTGPFAVGGAAGEFAASNFGVSQWNGRGAQSYFGQTQQYRTTTGVGFAGGTGSGGSGAYSFVSAAAQAGGNGGDGLIVITEFTT